MFIYVHNWQQPWNKTRDSSRSLGFHKFRIFEWDLSERPQGWHTHGSKYTILIDLIDYWSEICEENRFANHSRQCPQLIDTSCNFVHLISNIHQVMTSSHPCSRRDLRSVSQNIYALRAMFSFTADRCRISSRFQEWRVKWTTARKIVSFQTVYYPK